MNIFLIISLSILAGLAILGIIYLLYKRGEKSINEKNKALKEKTAIETTKTNICSVPSPNISLPKDVKEETPPVINVINEVGAVKEKPNLANLFKNNPCSYDNTIVARQTKPNVQTSIKAIDNQAFYNENLYDTLKNRYSTVNINTSFNCPKSS